MIDYIRNGDDIYRKSFSIIRSEAKLDSFPADLAHVAVRLIHACGMTDLVQDLAASLDAVKIGRDALALGAPIFAIRKWWQMELLASDYPQIMKLFVR